MGEFFFRIKGDDCSDISIVQKGSTRKVFEEKSLEVAKVKAESWCRGLEPGRQNSLYN